MNDRMTIKQALNKIKEDGMVDNKLNTFLFDYGVNFEQLCKLENSDEIIHQILIDFADYVKTKRYNKIYQVVVKGMNRNGTLKGGSKKKSKRNKKKSRRRNRK